MTAICGAGSYVPVLRAVLERLQEPAIEARFSLLKPRMTPYELTLYGMKITPVENPELLMPREREVKKVAPARTFRV